ncbi:MAG: glycosyltransferase family 1 protein [Mesorhizobium sp.]|uniref:glycosyltransferase family 4 protein n=1 Tax=Mesorhizobium sp. TaxID=1871066 RepID=UPI000FE51140|nr:glycosyltransferase family 1 protein [Mesorhizobium sp.]RWP42695.1 MAG: glycosyltransferase family 1 protein [Mesorhizobium sp.]
MKPATTLMSPLTTGRHEEQAMTGLTVGIDASNLRGGGGITHLVGLLDSAEPEVAGIQRVVIWGPPQTLSAIGDRPWLSKRQDRHLEQGAIARAWWQRRRLTQLLRDEGCDVLFSPGGSVFTDFKPVVTMSRNLLPFELYELFRYRVSWKTLRLLILRWGQTRALRGAQGVIFLTEYARSVVMRSTGPLRGDVVVIPHGVDPIFRKAPRRYSCRSGYPQKLLYVSPFEPYKHQKNVADAVIQLQRSGLDLKMTFVGPRGPSTAAFEQFIESQGDAARLFNVLGALPHREMPNVYESADYFVYASSCENMPNILLEAMASGLPIASSSRGPMKEILGDAGVYFDPEHVPSIAEGIRALVSGQGDMAQKSFERAMEYSWEQCARQTFSFLANVSRKNGATTL